MKEIKDPCLTIINKNHRFNAEDYKQLKYIEVAVRQGDRGRNTAYIAKNAYQAFQEAQQELISIGGDCWLNSAGRNEQDQQYAINEKFNEIYNGKIDKLKAQGVEITEEIDTKVKQESELETSQVTLPVGFSEHHCGLAIDIGVDMTNVQIPEKIKQHYPTITSKGALNFITRRMIMEKHGFILRYPTSPRLYETTGVLQDEGWHWRFIGSEHSQRMAKLRDLISEPEIIERSKQLLKTELLKRKQTDKSLTDEKIDNKVNSLMFEEVFLEDYEYLLQQDIDYNSEPERLEKFAQIFKTKILGIESTSTFKK